MGRIFADMQSIAAILAFSLGPMEITLVLAVLILFFGAKRIPNLARGLGKSISEFKKGQSEGTVEKEEGVKEDRQG